MAGCLTPTKGRLRRFDSVSQVLAVGNRHLAQRGARGVEQSSGISAIGSGLLAANIQLGRTVQTKRRARIAGERRHRHKDWQLSRGFGIASQPLPAAFAAKTAFTDTAKAGSGIKHIGPIDPDHPSNQLWCNIQGQIDVFAPNCRGQPIARIIGQLHRLSRGSKRRTDQNRPKYFLLHQAVRRRQSGD